MARRGHQLGGWGDVVRYVEVPENPDRSVSTLASAMIAKERIEGLEPKMRVELLTVRVRPRFSRRGAYSDVLQPSSGWKASSQCLVLVSLRLGQIATLHPTQPACSELVGEPCDTRGCRASLSTVCGG